MIVSAISDIPNVKNISDDAIICGVNAQEHDQAPMLTRFQELNFTLRKDNSVSDVRSLLGMTNYVSRFIRNYADIVAPLRDLTHKGVEFKWQEVHQKALHQLKCSLTCDAVMAYFDPHNKTALFVDASPVGLGAMQTQSGKVISYASKALSSVEWCYSQI